MIKLVQLTEAIDADSHEELGYYCYSPSWYRLCEKIFHYKLVRYSILRDETHIGKFSYVVLKSKIFGNRMISMPFSDSGGIYLNNGISISHNEEREIIQRLIGLLDKEAVKSKIAYAELRGVGSLLSGKNIDGKFLKASPYVSFTINTKLGYGSIREKYNICLIRNLRKADKFVEVSVGDGLDVLLEIYRIYLVQMRKFGSPPLPIEYFSELLKNKLAMIFLAKIRNKIVAFLLVFTFNNSMYADINASLPEYDSFFPKMKLYATSIRFACHNNYTAYDFMRTRDKSGVYLHKLQWGGREERIYYFYRLYNKKNILNIDPELGIFRLPRSILRITPLAALKAIGPKLRSEIGK